MEKAVQIHPFPPLYDENARVLILGSFPSVKSRAEAFFYAHPQNRFWRVLSAVLEEPAAVTVEEKREMLLRRHVALWDVVGRCEIAGSSDASISGVVPNDLRPILAAADIQAIFCNGGTSHRYYRRLCEAALGRKAEPLPSTSPANASYSLERLTQVWRTALTPYIGL